MISWVQQKICSSWGIAGSVRFAQAKRGLTLHFAPEGMGPAALLDPHREIQAADFARRRRRRRRRRRTPQKRTEEAAEAGSTAVASLVPEARDRQTNSVSSGTKCFFDSPLQDLSCGESAIVQGEQITPSGSQVMIPTASV